jgi:exo-beta-1,3-glucanase (GH17 family)
VSRIISIAALLSSAVPVVALWAWLGRPIDLPDVPGGRIQCLSYAPHDGDQTPLVADFVVPPARIAADLDAIRVLSGCIRTYAARGPFAEISRLAAARGLDVMQGIWISGNPEDDAAEIEAGLALAAAWPDTVRTLVVGNEVLLRRELTGRELAEKIGAVRARAPAGVAIAYADIFEFWRRNPEVAAAVDRILVHVLPYWDDPTPVSVDEVQDHVRMIVARARATFAGHAVAIGEIGWPSAGRTRGGAVPSRVNEARFVRAFAASAEATNLPYNLIEAIDQPWKRLPEGTVGGFWGVLDADRSPKFGLSGPVSEWPNWRSAAIFSVVVGVLALLAGACVPRRPADGVGRVFMIASVGHLLGCLLVFQARMVGEVATGAWGWTVGAMGMAVSVAAAMSLIRRHSKSGSVLVPPRVVVLLAAAYLGMTLAVDPRHRDIPTAFFVLPAILAVGTGRRVPGPASAPGADDREAAWLATVAVAGSAIAAWREGAANVEAMTWLAVVVALSLPVWPSVRIEVRRLAGRRARP